MNKQTRKFIFGIIIFCIGLYSVDSSTPRLFHSDWTGFWTGFYLWGWFILGIGIISNGLSNISESTKEKDDDKDTEPIYTIDALRFYLPFPVKETENADTFILTRKEYITYINNPTVYKILKSSNFRSKRHDAPDIHLGCVYNGSMTDRSGKTIHIHVEK